MASFLDVVRFTAVSSGTVDFVVSALVTGYQTPATANAVNGAIYRYRAENAALTEWEIGYGAYTVGSVTLARTTVLFNSLGTTAKISFTAPPQVGVVALAEDLIFITPPQGRVTLQSGVPVMANTQSAKTTIFYTPYVGNQIPIYDGTSFRNVTFAELSVATTDTAKSPAAIGASKVNDWFIWDDAGTTRIGHGPDWTSDSTRSAGTVLVMVNGIFLNNASITNGPAASRGTWVGTTRSNGSSQLDFIFGASAAGGTAAFFGVWNMYNRVNVVTTVTDSNASWVTTTSATFAALDTGGTGSGLNNRISAVSGSAEDGVSITLVARTLPAAASSAGVLVGFALNATNVADKQAGQNASSGSVVIAGSTTVSNTYSPQLGFNFWQAVQSGDGTNTGTVAGGAYEGLSGQFRM